MTNFSVMAVIVMIVSWCFLGVKVICLNNRSKDSIIDRYPGVLLRDTDMSWITSSYESELSQLTGQVRQRFSEDTSNTLAVMILFAFSLEMPLSLDIAARLTYLHCSLYYVAKNLSPYTKAHVYIWVKATEISRLPEWMTSLPSNFMVLPIPESSWQAVGVSSAKSSWNYGDSYPEDYFLMGRWRNTFQFSFVQRMGYEYMLQLDDDAFILDPIDLDIVSHFRKYEHRLGTRNTRLREVPSAVQGLAEFVRYWMVTRNMTTPAGELYKTLSPAGIDGLNGVGWNKLIYCSCFMIFDINFWMQDIILDFMNLVLKTGSDIEQRWNDQGVQNMVKLLFIPNYNISLFSHLVAHGKPELGCMRDLGCALSLDIVGYRSTAKSPPNATLVSRSIVHQSNQMIYSFETICVDPVELPTMTAAEQEAFILLTCINPAVNAFLEDNNLVGQLTADSVIDVAMQRWREAKALSQPVIG